MSVTDTAELIRLTALTGAFEYFQNKGRSRAAPLRPILRAGFIGLARTAHHIPLVMVAAAQSLTTAGFCDATTYRDLLQGIGNPTEPAWELAKEGDCVSWYGAFIRDEPDHATPALWALDTHATSADRLALQAFLAGDDVLTRVAPPDRDTFHFAAVRRYARSLAAAGLTDRLLTFFDRQPPDVRTRLITSQPEKGSVTVDGLEITLDGPPHDGLPLDLAAAFALRGRTKDAETILPPYAAKLEHAKASMSCTYDEDRPLYQPALWPSPSRCGTTDVDDRRLIVLDHLLHHATDDPYPLAEALYADHNSLAAYSQGIWLEVTCAIFTEDRLRSVCDQSMRRDADAREDEAKRQAVLEVAGILATALPGHEALRRELEMALTTEAVGRRGGEAQAAKTDPSLPAFTSLPLPPAMRGPGRDGGGWIKTLAPLPSGFRQVRVWRGGRRVAVISVSEIYDNASSMSRGGYWLHLSDDGGRTWHQPLYTGLAERFPYVVKPTSKLPLLKGDDLTLAVDADKRLSTGPLGEETFRRQASDLYLRIPLADMALDSDGDGMSDIAERHLLLPPAGTTVMDGPLPLKIRPDLPRPCPLESRYAAMALATVLTPQSRFLDERFMVTLDKAETTGAASAVPDQGYRDTQPPIVLVGHQADFACLRANRRLIIYDTNDPRVRWLNAAPGNFAPALVTPIIFNATHDRGFIAKGNRGSGIVIRMRRIRDGWRLDMIDYNIT